MRDFNHFNKKKRVYRFILRVTSTSLKITCQRKRNEVILSEQRESYLFVDSYFHHGYTEIDIQIWFPFQFRSILTTCMNLSFHSVLPYQEAALYKAHQALTFFPYLALVKNFLQIHTKINIQFSSFSFFTTHFTHT